MSASQRKGVRELGIEAFWLGVVELGERWQDSESLQVRRVLCSHSHLHQTPASSPQCISGDQRWFLFDPLHMPQVLKQAAISTTNTHSTSSDEIGVPCAPTDLCIVVGILRSLGVDVAVMTLDC